MIECGSYQNFPAPGQFQEDGQSISAGHGVSVGEADRPTLSGLQFALLGIDGEQLVVHHLHLHTSKQIFRISHTQRHKARQ